MSISDRLDEIQDRADNATEGPWTWASHRTVDGDEWAVFDPHDWAMASNRDGWAPDAEFIAHARTDVPALVAAVRRRDAALRAVLDACSTYEKTQAIYGIEMGQREIIRVVRAEISAALGEGS